LIAHSSVVLGERESREAAGSANAYFRGSLDRCPKARAIYAK